MLLTALLACNKPTPPPAATEPAPAPAVEMQPEAATGCRVDLKPVHSPAAMVVSAHPEASAIGAEVLAAGGSAADAAAAVAIALTLVEPQSSGIGGGAFALHYDAETQQLTAWDGRETAPAAATETLFHDASGPRSWVEVVPGGLSVGTPGLLRLLEALQSTHGSVSWEAVVTPAADLAEGGFTVTPRMARSIVQMEGMPMDSLRRNPSAAAYFYPDGAPLKAGQSLKNPALATTLRAIATDGADAFYTGAIAEHIVAAVHDAPMNPGLMTAADLAAYRPVKRQPVCLDYRGHQVCGHPPPTSGGVTVLEILGLLEGHPVSASPPDDPTTAHRFAEAVRLAWADRDRYVADPAYVTVPVDALLSDVALAARGGLITDDARLDTVTASVLELPPAPAAPTCPEGDDTTHIVVVDASGDVVSMTSSIEMAWGSGVFVDGFLLNNQLTDFSRAATDDAGQPIANRVQACKRPRSSMSPIVVLDDGGHVELAIGSPGGSRIIQYTARALTEILDHGLDVQQAISRPNLVQTAVLELESDCGTPAWTETTAQALADRGHEVVDSSLNSGLHGIQRVSDGWLGGVDPRREGQAIAVPPPE